MAGVSGSIKMVRERTKARGRVLWGVGSRQGDWFIRVVGEMVKVIA